MSRIHRSVASARAQQEGQADLHGVVKAARIEAGQRGDLLQPVAERVAVDGDAGGAGGEGAVFGKEELQGFEQLRLLIERAEEMLRQVALGLLVRNADESSDAKLIERMHLRTGLVAAPEDEREAGVLIRMRKAADARMIAPDAD